eukprot:CAMPEP_0184528932 /NCGR_PEP_ID=MMETSP0198_2-20121128/12076_1 /TAXON_ID=1112570 /ORGANISM="Thraustochytrium sp., Strain LLF1b" /LENGTH=85 /DNA_ID=CAMNT_0026920853 /DNA_START=110 /DNA_END=364 /DNA_ORIENTATION=-
MDPTTQTLLEESERLLRGEFPCSAVPAPYIEETHTNDGQVSSNSKALCSSFLSAETRRKKQASNSKAKTKAKAKQKDCDAPVIGR